MSGRSSSPYLTLREVARRSNLPMYMVWWCLLRRDLRARLVGGAWTVHESDLHAWWERHKIWRPA